ncbi:response regulator [Methylobacterium dankookense]|uniref:Sensor histidine kinase RcsC n=3 Tax=Methylobacterium dankookense TaxID=560405 RepID=A0ABQ4RDV2_9HYPH|nr:response regulator [Methylobacterium dankookense]GJD55607.1 Sensor histidine kinase RcsC [Methylobacterium dankookense]
MSTQILLVEDDPDSQDLVRALCAAHGYGVDVAADGFLGLRLLSERRHPVVLIDYHLPEMDGYALARLMREIVGARGVRLVGITADRHGLASRRGADALFDAILVKPLEPERLHATLDRLARGEAPAARPAASPPPPAQGADLLWRRRGLPARPRAVACPDLPPEIAAAVAQVFDLGPAEGADLILLAAETGIEALRALRAEGPGRFLPAFDLTGRLGPACDGAFRVDEPDSWDGLVHAVRAFARRRDALDPALRAATDPAARLLAALFVGDRVLALGHCADPTGPVAGTGLSQAGLMGATLALTEAGLAACEAAPGGVVVRLTETGRAAAQGGAEAAALAGRHGVRPGAAPAGNWRRPNVVPSGAATHPADALPLLDPDRVRTLQEMIGPREVERLGDNLLARLATAFPAEAPLPEILREAHALVAMSGSLGFVRLSAACRALQDAAPPEIPDALTRARQTVRDTLGRARA